MVKVVFDVDEAVEFINKNGYLRVGLQFPSDLLIYSVDLCEQFRKRTSAFIVILGDTPYSNCCVDELAGKRWDIEAVIHFGNACLTKPVGSVDVFYVFGDVHCPLIDDNADDIVAHVKHHIRDIGGSVLFFYDFRFLKSARLLYYLLKSIDVDVIFTEPALPNLTVIEDSTAYRHLGRIFHLKDKSEFPKGLLYLGECDSNFYSILVSMKDAYKIAPIVIDPDTGKVNFAGQSASKLLRKRYFLMEKAKSAKRIGILMGSLSISKYMDVVDRIKHLLCRAKIAYTTLVVGRLNEAKLMNVPDLDALVLVACPQASLYNNPNLLIPVITPFELECILYERCKYEDEDYVNEKEELIPKKRQWNGLWLPLDFASHILDTESETYVPEDDVVISGQADEDIVVRPSGTMVSRDDTNWSLAVAFAEMVADRHDSWNGLDPALGMTEPLTSIQPGRSGIPTEYSNICK
nr:Diphthamide biosynthesis protein 2 [Hymenolepis microstoma]